MRKSYIVGTLLLFGCTTSAVVPEPIDTESSSSSSVVEQIEQIPSELSIEHFGEMELVGTGLTLNFIESQNEAYVRHAIEYTSNGLSISGILNIPKGEGPFPLVILNHGYIAPSIYTRGRGLKREQDYLAREGFAVLHTDYRGHAESDPSPDTERRVYDAGLEYSMDSVNAINAVKASGLDQIDTTRVGMMGHSMGGGVTLNILTGRPDTIAAAVLYAPVHADAFENYNRWRRERDEDDRTAEVLGEREEHVPEWDALSSLTYLDAIKAPILLFQGTEDADVPVLWSDFLAEKLEEEGKDITYERYEGEKHEFVPQWQDFMKKTGAFFHAELDKHVPLAAPLSNAKERITKKPFGILIDPDTSPVQPERFSGYHTATDFELLDGEKEFDVEVSAFCSGPVRFAGTVDGYGGVLIQECRLDGDKVTVLYGHISLDSVVATEGTRLETGQFVALLGEGYTEETDGERPHLHLAVHKGDSIEYKGYVESIEELNEWIDPMTLLED